MLTLIKVIHISVSVDWTNCEWNFNICLYVSIVRHYCLLIYLWWRLTMETQLRRLGYSKNFSTIKNLIPWRNFSTSKGWEETEWGEKRRMNFRSPSKYIYIFFELGKVRLIIFMNQSRLFEFFCGRSEGQAGSCSLHFV